MPPNCDKAERIKHKRTRACFEFQNCLDMSGEDEDKLDMVRANLQDLDSKFQKGLESADVQSQENRVDAFVGSIPANEEGVRNPNLIRNKGCGTRMKSSREISVQDKGQRMQHL